MGDEIFAHDVAERVFELHVLDEEVVFRIDSGATVGVFEIEAEPFLDSQILEAWRPRCEVHEEDQIERKRGCEDRVAAEKIDFKLHGVTKPAEDVDIVPTFFIIPTWRVIVDANFVVNVTIELGVKVGLEDVLENAELGHFLGFKGLGVVENFAVTIAEDVGGVPARDTEVANLEGGGENGLDEGLAGFEVFAGNGCIHPAG